MADRRTLRDIEKKRFEDQVGRIVLSLRDIADQVEREGLAFFSSSSVYRGVEYSAAAHSVIHTVMWGVANLNLDGLSLVGAEVDTADERERG